MYVTVVAMLKIHQPRHYSLKNSSDNSDNRYRQNHPALEAACSPDRRDASSSDLNGGFTNAYQASRSGDAPPLPYRLRAYDGCGTPVAR
jgi:hypothetical protein